MHTATLIGVPAFRGAYIARYLQHGHHPDVLIPLLRRIWAHTFSTDTPAMLAGLLAEDWARLTPDPPPFPPHHPWVPGLGQPAATSEPAARTGRLNEDLEGPLEWMYLVHVDHQTVAVYEATCHRRWLRHSIHHLNPVQDLFITEPDLPDAPTVCTVCGAVDEIEHHDTPSMAGYGHDTSTACTRCGSSVTTDPMFGAHLTRKPWPPTTPTGAKPHPAPEHADAEPRAQDTISTRASTDSGSTAQERQQQRAVTLIHTPDMRLPHYRFRVTDLHRQSAPRSYTAQLTLDGQPVATLHADAGRLQMLVPPDTPLDRDSWDAYIAACRLADAPTTGRRVLEALVEEQDLTALTTAVWARGGTVVRLLDHDRTTIEAHEVIPRPVTTGDYHNLSARLATRSALPDAAGWVIWTGNAWQWHTSPNSTGGRA